MHAQLIALASGVLLLTGALMVWVRSWPAIIVLLAAQGVALSALVALVAADERDVELAAVAGLVLVVKGLALPALLARGARGTAPGDEAPLWPPPAGLLAVVALTTLAYAVARPLTADGAGPAERAVPVGIALVLIGFLTLVTRRRAPAQLTGFLMIDNGIATVAFLTAAGVPLVVELGVSLDVVLVALILVVLSRRLHAAFGGTDLRALRELRDR